MDAKRELDDSQQSGQDSLTAFQQIHFKRRQDLEKYVDNLDESIKYQKAKNLNIMLLLLLFLDLPQFIYFLVIILD